MRGQSAIEFLSTYSYVFIILAVMISAIAFIATAPSATFTSQCVSLSTVRCSYASIYSNGSYSTLTLYVTNGQAVPINITNVTTIINGKQSLGYCAPSFVYPGAGSVCISNVQLASKKLILGYFAINGGYCNSQLSELPEPSNCTYEKVSYAGSFQTYASASYTPIFAITAENGPYYEQMPQYQSSPGLSPNFSVVENGEFVAGKSGNSIWYSFATPSDVGNTYMKLKASAFPSSVQQLNNVVPCAEPYNSMLSVAYTIIYLNEPSTVGINAVPDNAIAVYYKAANSVSWTSLLGSVAWPGAISEYSGITTSLPKGSYDYAVMWANSCGNGIQAVNLTT